MFFFMREERSVKSPSSNNLVKINYLTCPVTSPILWVPVCRSAFTLIFLNQEYTLGAVFQIRLILIWIRIRILGSVSCNNGSCSKSDLKSEKYDLFCYLWSKYLSVNISLKVLKKCMIFLWFLLKFSMILADFLLPGSGS